MDKDTSEKLSMASSARYAITVRGNLPARWAEWFNGTTIQAARATSSSLNSSLTCRVRDQAELLGILNRLNSLNLPLLEVALIQEEDCA